MNRYYIDVIGSSNKTKYEIEANTISWSEAGLYEFTKHENGIREVIAYFPVNRTVISKIEYDINND